MDYCPVCNEPIFATVPCYISQVSVDDHSHIVAWSWSAYPPDQCLDLEDDDHGIQLYCDNGHDVRAALLALLAHTPPPVPARRMP